MKSTMGGCGSITTVELLIILEEVVTAASMLEEVLERDPCLILCLHGELPDEHTYESGCSSRLGGVDLLTVLVVYSS